MPSTSWPTWTRIRKRRHRLSGVRSEEHTSELQSHVNLVCRLLLEKKNLHRPRAVLTGVADGALQEREGDPSATVAGSDADTPRRPHRQVVDVRDLPGPPERQLGPG